MQFTILKTLQSEHAAPVEHAQSEAAVMYPAAILVGQLVRQRLGLRTVALACEWAP